MTVIENTRALSLVDKNGEVIDIDLSPVSVETAGARLPQVKRAIAILRDHITFLEGVIVSSFAPGQTERKIGTELYQYVPETEWEITDSQAMWDTLVAAEDREEITDDEFGAAAEVKTTYVFHNGRLNVLARRVPAIDRFRTQRIGNARLKTKK